jgi:soluble lytic murein transglycosylase-like protein
VIGTVALVRLSVPSLYRKLFEQVGAETGVSPNLLHAIAWHESGMNPKAISKQNNDGSRDYGLMQINDHNFAALGLNQQTALDAESSVRAAAKLLSQIRQRAPDVADTLAVYNAGPSGRTGGPKLTADGSYINTPYVHATLGKLFLVTLAYPGGG